MKIQQSWEEVWEWKWGLNIGICSVYSSLYYVNMHERERRGNQGWNWGIGWVGAFSGKTDVTHR